MEEHIFDENNGPHNTLAEDGMYYPDLTRPKGRNYPIGKYRRMRKKVACGTSLSYFCEVTYVGRIKRASARNRGAGKD